MDATGRRLQRTIVHRHTPSGRRFWGEVAAILGRRHSDPGPALAALLREAASGPLSLADWFGTVGLDTPEAVPAVAEALDHFEAPVPHLPSGVMSRIRGAVRPEPLPQRHPTGV